MEGRDAFGSQIQRRPLFLGQPLIRRSPFLGRHFQRTGQPPVDSLRPLVQRRVAPRPDIPQDARDRLRRRDPRPKMRSMPSSTAAGISWSSHWTRRRMEERASDGV